MGELTTNVTSNVTERSSRQTLPCSSPPRHSENGCSALGGFCSCFASSETAAKAHTHTRAAAAAVAAAPYPKTFMSSGYSSSNTGCPATSWRPALCAPLSKNATQAANEPDSPCKLISSYSLLPVCVQHCRGPSLSLSLSVSGELRATRYFKIKGSGLTPWLQNKSRLFLRPALGVTARAKANPSANM